LPQVAILTIFSILFSASAFAQACLPADISISTQQSVDNFQLDHGPCDLVTGNLSVVGNDITNLGGLTQLTAIDGQLFISDSPALSSVLGLGSLTMVGGDLTVQANNALENLNGLNSLQSIGGNFFIFRNAVLANLGGLESLTFVGNHFWISSNPKLADVDGLGALSNLGGTLRIWDNNGLKNLNGFFGLETVQQDLEIISNSALVNLDGFSNVRTVGGSLLIQLNSSLVSIEGLSSLVSEIGILAILSNTALTSLDGLDGLTEVGQLIITNNTKLSDCQGVLKLVDTIVVSVSNNQPGCNSVAEILAANPFLINAGLNDAWYNPETNGQGFLIVVFPDIQQMFMAWFTYETERPPTSVKAILGEPGHRWLTAQGPYEDNAAALHLYNTVGGVFDLPQPVPVFEEIGEIHVEFSSCNSGTVAYDMPDLGLQGVVPIERIAPDNIALCEILSVQ
jgi:hypothetical protein